MEHSHQIRSALDVPIEALVALARQTFVESHVNSASAKDLDTYLDGHFTNNALKKDVQNPANTYRMISQQDRLIGFSKIILNRSHAEIAAKNITKMERIYVLKAFHGKGLGQELYDYNLNLIKENDQAGIWLYTWKGNHRAIAFYEKMGFKIIGHHDFKISEQHSNPNHLMWLGW